MPTGPETDLLLIRHAPVTGTGLCGRRDLPADCSASAALDGLRTMLARPEIRPARTITSPALRCRQTAAALGLAPLGEDARLWEQDFGDWEGAGDLPDLGAMSPAALAAHRPPAGESFVDLCNRAQPALRDLGRVGGRVAIVAHAGIVRAALALALGGPGPALSFEVAPLSLTWLRALPGGVWSVAWVNRRWD